MNPRASLSIPRRIGEAHEVDYSKPLDAAFGSLARDRIPVRSMAETDLHAIVAIDQSITGRARAAYLRQKLMESLHQSDVRVSLDAELDGRDRELIAFLDGCGFRTAQQLCFDLAMI